MNTVAERQAFEILEIPASTGLDPITVFWRNYELCKGSVTITCYGTAWTAYFGGMGGNTIQEFFAKADTDYFVNKLIDFRFQKQTKAHKSWLSRIINKIKSELATGEQESE